MKLFNRTAFFALCLLMQLLAVEKTLSDTPKIELVIETGHVLNINSVIFSPDGRILASGGNDGTIKLWEINSGRLLKTLESEADIISTISFSPDGKKIVSAAYNGNFILWDTQTGQQLRSFKGKSFGINLAVFSPDGKSLAFVNTDAEIKLWSVEKWEPTMSLSGHTSTVFALSFAPDGKTLATGSFDQTIKFWSLADGKVIRTISNYGFTVESVAFSPDGKRLVSTGNTDNKIKIWDAGTGDLFKSIVSPALAWATFSPTEKKIVSTAFKDGQAKLWDSESGQMIKTFGSPNRPITAANFSPNGKLLAVATDGDFAIRIWDISISKAVKVFENSTRYVWTTAFSPDGKKIASGNLDGTISLWSIENTTVLRIFSGHKAGGPVVKFSPDGKILATGSNDNAIKLWNAETGKFIRSLLKENELTLSINFSPDSKTLQAYISNGADPEELIRWDVATGRKVEADESNAESDFSDDGAEKDDTFSPNGRFRLVLGSAGKVDIFDVDSNDLLISFIATDKNDWIVTTPDGRFDTNKSLDRIEGLHWVVNNEILKPLPLELYLRHYFEPGLFRRLLKCAEEKSCDKEFKPLPSIAEINRIQPRVFLKEIKATVNNLVDVTVEVESVNEEINLSGADQNQRKSVASGVYDLRLFRDGQLVGVSTPKDKLAEFIKNAPRLAAETQVSGKLLNTPEDLAWRTANDIFSSKSENLKILSANKAEYTFRNIKMPKDGRQKTEFTAYAFNSDKVRSSLAGPVGFAIPPFVANAPKKGRAIILSIGVNASQISKFNLRYAANDARKMQEIIGGRFKNDISKYSEVVLIPLISDYDAKNEITENTAQKSVIKGVFSLLAGDAKDVPADVLKLIPNRDRIKPVEPEDTLIITYAGHGYADRNGIFYLLPFDVGADSKDLGAVLNNSISSDEISLWMQGVTAQEMTFIVDACNSAAAVEGSGFKPGPMGSRGLGQLAYDKGMRILAATQADNVALELNKLQQGLLSYVLLQNGIVERKADTEPEFERLTAKEWLTYAVKRVPEIYQEVEAGKQRLLVDGQSATVEQSRQLVQKTPKSTVNLQQPTLFDFNRQTNQKYFLRLF